MKNSNLSLLDREQAAMRMFDEKHDAQRVILVDGDIAETIKESLKDLKIEIKATQDQATMLPSLIPQVQVIEIPTIIKEIEVREIEKQILIPEYKLIEIEKPIIVKEIQIIEVEKAIVHTEVKTIEVPVVPKALLWLFGIQVLISLLTLLLHK